MYYNVTYILIRVAVKLAIKNNSLNFDFNFRTNKNSFVKLTKLTTCGL